MKNITTILLFILSIHVATASTDEELSKSVSNTWINTSSGTGADVIESVTYNADGTFKSSYLITYKDTDHTHDAIITSGKWFISKGVFTEIVDQSSAPARFPVGTTFRRTFDYISSGKITLRAEDGQTTAELWSIDEAKKHFPNASDIKP